MTSIKQRLHRLAARTVIAALVGLFVFVSLGIPPTVEARIKAVDPAKLRTHYGLPRQGIPGVSGGVGTEVSLNYILSLVEFDHIPSGGTTYYVSSDDGGRADEGDDDNDGLTWATAVKSLCHIDGIIEAATSPIHVIFDSDGSNDQWKGLSAELDCKNGDDWDGSLGPPNASCNDSIDRPCVILSASDPSNPVRFDLKNMRQEQVEVNCSGAEYGGNACDNNNDALFFGRTVAAGGVRNGWLAVQNFAITHYPNDQHRQSAAVQKNVVGGNVLTLNLDAGWLMGQDVAFSSQAGGFDIHINPVFRVRPPSDFNSDCSASLDSELACADQDDYGTTTALCSAENTPYSGCDAGAPFDLQVSQALVVPAAGGTIIISDQTYRYSINQQLSGRANAIFRAVNGSDLILLGPMQLHNEVHGQNAAPFDGGDNDDASAISFDATSGGLGQTDTAQRWIVAFAEFTENWGHTAGSGTEPGAITIDFDGADTGIAWNLDLYGIVVRSLVNTGAIKLPDLHADQVTSSKGTITFNCSSIHATDGVLLFSQLNADYDSTAAPAFDISARDSYLLESLGYIGYLILDAPTTITAAIASFAALPEYECAGDTTCATGFFENGNNDLAITRPAGAAPITRPGVCDTEFSFNMPTNDGETDSNKLHRNHNGWLPAYVAGERITSWRFGSP